MKFWGEVGEESGSQSRMMKKEKTFQRGRGDCRRGVREQQPVQRCADRTVAGITEGAGLQACERRKKVWKLWGQLGRCVCVCVNVCVNEEFIEEDTRSGSGERYLNARLIFFSCSLLAVNISRTFLNRRSLLGNKVPIICPPLKSLLSLLARWKWRLAGAGFLSRSLAQGCVQLGPGWSRLL